MEFLLKKHLPVVTFLKEYWQKRPLLLRHAVSDFEDFMPADELAGLACEEEVESRLVLQTKIPHGWSLESGPFEESRFTDLPESHWTLLVQDVDKHVAEAAGFLEQFNFLPRWRIDDIMISYAEDQGSVGPHTDSYDVFLIQLEGQRRWQLGHDQYSDDDLLEDCDLRVLKHFDVETEYVLNPGDMLYLPPNVAHWGVALGPCMTLSVGLTTPTHKELFASWSANQIEKHMDDSYYSDPDLTQTDSSFEIDATSINRVRKIIEKNLQSDEENFANWFSSFVSEGKSHLYIEPPEQQLDQDQLKSILRNSANLSRHPYVKAFYRCGKDGNCYLYIHGEEFSLPDTQHKYVRLLCEQTIVNSKVIGSSLENSDFLETLTALVNLGYFFIDD